MPFKVTFFTGESTVVHQETEEDVIDEVWHWTSAQIETLEKIEEEHRSISEGQPNSQRA